MSEIELEFLIYNLQYDVSEFTEQYIVNMSKGIHNYAEMFKVYLVNQYLNYINNYDVLMIDFNPLNPEEMRNILNHTNIILNKNYQYGFEKRNTIW